MKWIKWAKKRIVIWMFIHRIGKVSKEYYKLNQSTERVSFLMEYFGRDWIDVIEEHKSQLRLDVRDAFNDK